MTLPAPLRHPNRRAVAVPLAASLALLATACANDPDPTASTSQAPASPAAPATSAAPATGRGGSGSDTAAGGGTRIRITIGGTEVNGTLTDNATARSLIDQLPVTVDFQDMNGEEKTGHLARELSMTGRPTADDPVPGDIGYYAPGGDLVLYYGDVGRYAGIARIGTLEETTPIQDQTGDFSAVVQLAR